MSRSKTGDGIDDQQSIVMFVSNLCDASDVVPRAGGTLSSLHKDGTYVGSELGANIIQRKRRAIRRGQHVHVAAESFGQTRPALTELSGGEHQNLVARRGQVRYRSFHHARARTSQYQDVVLGADEFLHIRKDTLEQSKEKKGDGGG